jgi:hypothetical protein
LVVQVLHEPPLEDPPSLEDPPLLDDEPLPLALRVQQ